MLLQQLERLGYGTLELRIVTVHHLRRGVLDLNVGRDALVLDRPLSVDIYSRRDPAR